MYSQSGPIPAYAHALVAWVFGNTPLVYVSLLAVVSSANVGLAYALVRRAANVPVAVFVTAIGVLPIVLIPGALAGGYTSAAYIPLERTLLLLVALSWAAPASRSVRRSFLIGSLLGAWQGLRFGAVAAAAASILVIDFLHLWSIGFTRAHLRAWMATLLPIAGAFVAFELIWAVYAFATLPAAVALDLLWPLYSLESVRGSARCCGWLARVGRLAADDRPVSVAAVGRGARSFGVAAMVGWRGSFRDPRSGTIGMGGWRVGVHPVVLLHHRMLRPVSDG